MLVFLLLVFGQSLLGLVAALVWWAAYGRRRGGLRGTAAVSAVIAAMVVLLADGIGRIVATGLSWFIPVDLPASFWGLYGDFRFLVPPIAGLVAMAVLAFPIIGRRTSTTAVLAPRGPLSFIRPRWLIAPGVVLALLVILTIWCGAVSQPEEGTGKYTMWLIEIGDGNAIGTSIYGWFYSLPVLAVLGVMLSVAGVNLALIARPAFADDEEADRRSRELRSRNVIAAITATLLLSLSQALALVGGAASLRGSFGAFNSWTPIAAFEPVLGAASFAAAAFGVAFWVSIALTAVPTRARTLARAAA